MSQNEKDMQEQENEEFTAQEIENQEMGEEAEGCYEAQEELLDQELSREKKLEEELKEQQDKYLRLLAEYDNFRKRSLKEKENAWTTAKADTAAAFLPVYDNLERALKQETADEAYAKGVEMTMSQLKTVLEKLGIEEIKSLGETFDPELHDAVMHVEDETVGENTIVEVFQSGFRTSAKIIRHAMVKVAN